MKKEKMFIIGRILKPHGLAGEVKSEILTDDPDIFLELPDLFIADPKGGEPVRVEIETVRFHKKSVLIKVDIINSPEEVVKFRGHFLEVPESYMPDLEEDEYYVMDLIGMAVMTIRGEFVGNLVNVVSGGDNDVYEILNPKTGRINMIPARKQFIDKIDMINKKIIVTPIEGMIEP